MKWIKRKGREEGERKRKREEVESSEEEGEGEREMGVRIRLEIDMLVKIRGVIHYKTDYKDIKGLLFSYPEGRLCGQWNEETKKIEVIEFDE